MRKHQTAIPKRSEIAGVNLTTKLKEHPLMLISTNLHL